MSCFVNEKCGFVNSTEMDTPCAESVICRPTVTPCFRASSFSPLRITTHFFSSL